MIWIPSGQRKLYLTRYQPKFAVICLDTIRSHWSCCRDMATSIDTLPLEMLCHIFSFVGSDILLVCWNVSIPWHLVITQRSCWQKEGVWLQISNLEISHADTPSAENYLKKVLHVNSEKLRTIRITQVKADLRRFGVLVEHHFQYLSFPWLSTVDLSGTSFHSVQVIGIVTKCRELVNLILRQCKDVNDHAFKRFVSMPILKEELPSTLKYVDVAGSGCSVHAVLILVKEWFFPGFFPKMTGINVEGIQISIKKAAFLCIERPSLLRFQDPFSVLLGLPKLGDEGSLEGEIYDHFLHFSNNLAVLQSHKLL